MSDNIIATSAAAPLIATSTAAPSTTAVKRAVRTTAGQYLGNAKGQAAFHVDGSLLDQIGYVGNDTFAYASAWRDPHCPFCILPPFRRIVPRSELRECPDHGKQILPTDDPFPMSEGEFAIAEEREWSAIAAKLYIPRRYRSAHVVTSQQTPAIRAVREFVDDDNNDTRSLWLAGPAGVGKTWGLIAALRKEAVPGGGNGIEFYRMGELVRELISEESDEALERCIEADILYLDDVGSAYLKDGGVAETLFEEIIVAREADEAPMMATTNLTLPRVAEVLGDRIADRIRGGWAEWVALPGSSLRRKARPRMERT